MSTTLRYSPTPGPVVYVLDLADRLISKAGPFAAAGIMVGSIYWTAVTYGAVTVMQVLPVIPPERFCFRIGLFCLVRTLTLKSISSSHACVYVWTSSTFHKCK